MEPATIKIFLVHGNPNGLRTAELSNWSGKAISAPRNDLPAFFQREELSSPGVYLLTGEDSETGDKTIYIGEAEDVRKRIKNHIDKDFWNSATVFISKDDNLTKSHIKYLEGKLISLALDNPTSKIINSVSSGAKLPESDTAEMDIFLQKILQLLPVIGITEFNRTVEKPIKEKDLLYCTIKGLSAKGKRTSSGFTVLAGSQAVLEHRPSAIHAKKRREILVEKGLLKPENNYLLFTKDIEFSSPSRAATIVRGGASNGLTAWKNSKGMSLKDIDAQET